MPWKSLTLDQLRILECARDGRQPWECLPNMLTLIGSLDQLIASGLLEEEPPNYRLTALGALALEARGAG